MELRHAPLILSQQSLHSNELSGRFTASRKPAKRRRWRKRKIYRQVFPK